MSNAPSGRRLSRGYLWQAWGFPSGCSQNFPPWPGTDLPSGWRSALSSIFYTDAATAFLRIRQACRRTDRGRRAQSGVRCAGIPLFSSQCRAGRRRCGAKNGMRRIGEQSQNNSIGDAKLPVLGHVRCILLPKQFSPLTITNSLKDLRRLCS